jgi:PadR family transcriptional regulator PadR
MKNDNSKVQAGGLYGSLEIMILRILKTDGPIHGLDVAKRIEVLSEEHLRVEEGALYPALHRLKRDGQIEGEWRISDKRRRARFYSITTAGIKHLERELGRWAQNTEAIGRVLGMERSS